METAPHYHSNASKCLPLVQYAVRSAFSEGIMNNLVHLQREHFEVYFYIEMCTVQRVLAPTWVICITMVSCTMMRCGTREYYDKSHTLTLCGH